MVLRILMRMPFDHEVGIDNMLWMSSVSRANGREWSDICWANGGSAIVFHKYSLTDAA